MALNPNNSPEAWITHDSVGNYAEALVACNHALQLNPAYALASTGRNLVLKLLNRS